MNEFSSLFNRLGGFILMFICGVGIVDVLMGPPTEVVQEPTKETVVRQGSFAIPPMKDTTWTLVAGGDVMLSRFVDTVIDRNGSTDYPFDGIRDIIQNADIAFANLENPVGPGAKVPDNSFELRADPDTLEGLKNAGFDVLSLANNHQSDIGQGAIGATVEYVKNADMAPIGAGGTSAEARVPAVYDMNGTRVAFLAYADRRFVSQVHFASDTKPGVNEAVPEIMEQDIKNAKSQSDVVVVSIHAGTEYQAEADQIQEELAQIAADAGADLVLGHHPHVVQPLKKIGNTWVAYSLGNLVFDQIWSEETQQGMLMQFMFRGKELVDIELIPVAMQNYVQPHRATGDVAQKIVDRLQVETVQTRDGRFLVEPEKPRMPVESEGV